MGIRQMKSLGENIRMKDWAKHFSLPPPLIPELPSSGSEGVEGWNKVAVMEAIWSGLYSTSSSEMSVCILSREGWSYCSKTKPGIWFRAGGALNFYWLSLSEFEYTSLSPSGFLTLPTNPQWTRDAS